MSVSGDREEMINKRNAANCCQKRTKLDKTGWKGNYARN